MIGVFFNLENDHTSPLLHGSGRTGGGGGGGRRGGRGWGHPPRHNYGKK